MTNQETGEVLPACSITDLLHTEARRYAGWLLAKGFTLDKKRLRFNDVVEVGLFYGRLGETFSTSLAIAGSREACEACIKGGVMEIDGNSLLMMIQPWMMTCADPRA